ncbi:MAG: deoxyhypusine synthase family protein [Nitrospira sp.]|nr:deoxyhypusine synthase family protein [Nitrospira sp.]
MAEEFEGPGILKSAYSKTPVYIPAFTDSEMGLDVATWAMSKKIDFTRSQVGAGGDFAVLRTLHDVCPVFNPYLDLNHYAEEVVGCTRLGIFTIGGGVPRNGGKFVHRDQQYALGLNVPPRDFTMACASARSPIIGVA